jgi:hypothetical protein
MTIYTVSHNDGALLPVGTKCKLTRRQLSARSHQVKTVDGVHIALAALGFKKGEAIEVLSPITDKPLLIRLGSPPEVSAPPVFRAPTKAQAAAIREPVKAAASSF